MTTHCIRFKNPRLGRRAFSGFTLMELLAVIAVVAVLAGIIISVVGKVRESARQAESLANVRTCAQAALLFANDNRGGLPYKPDALDAGNSILERKAMEPYLAWMSPAWFCPIVKQVQESAGAKASSPTQDWVGRIRYNYHLVSQNGYPVTGWFARSGRGSRNTAGVNVRSIATPSDALLFWNCDSGGRGGYNDGYAHVGMADGSVRRVPDDSYLRVSPSAVRAEYMTEQPAGSGRLRGFDF